MKDVYPTGKADLMTAFMLNAQVLTKPGGTWGMINLPSWMSLKSFEDLRHDLLRDQRIASMVHLGRGIFGSDFGSVAFVVTNAIVDGGCAVYRRLFEQHVDVRSVATIEALFLDHEYNRFEVAQSDFAAIPGSPIVYWLSEKMLTIFARFQRAGATVRPLQGLATADDSRFLRQWWEVRTSDFETRSESGSDAAASNHRWFPFTKGGGYRRWYGNNEFAVNWEHGGRELYEFRPRSVIRNPDAYFAPATTWGLITSSESSFRYSPPGFVLGHKGPAIPGQPNATPMQVQAILNSATVSRLIGVLSPGLGLEVGQVADLPVPAWDAADAAAAATLTKVARIDWDEYETSWDFAANPLVALAADW